MTWAASISDMDAAHCHASSQIIGQNIPERKLVLVAAMLLFGVRQWYLPVTYNRDREASFIITHHATGINLDIFVTTACPFDRSRYQRAQDHTLPGASESIKLASPEDVILNKLLCHQDGIESQKQWRDVQSMIRVQGQVLDLGYLRKWASALKVCELLEAALRGETPSRAGGNEELSQDSMF